MNYKVAIALSLVALLSVGIIRQTFAQTYVPGVKAGDYLTYSLNTNWISNNPTATVPSELVDLNNTQFKMTVSGVTDGTNVTATGYWRYSNGTTTPTIVTQDIESGTFYYFYGPAIIGSNLVAGDILHPTGNDALKVNQTVSLDYASGKRDTNVVEDTYTNDSVASETTTYYFDKTTGVLVQLNETSVNFNPQEKGIIIWKLTDTNLWQISSNTTDLLLPVVTIIVVVVAAVMLFAFYNGKQRGHKRKFKHSIGNFRS